jgi:hypothetical protein
MDSLIGTYREMAALGANFHGLSIMQHHKSVGRLVRKMGAKTLLDFGCGRGDAYKSPHDVYHSWGLKRSDITLYDPAYSERAAIPRGWYDVVVCSDVLEHVPADEVDYFVSRLFSFAKKAVWASVCCRAAKKTFPDGVTNLHVTVQPYTWWYETFSRSCPKGLSFYLVETP